MKKIMTFALACLLLLGITACSSAPAATPAASAKPSAAPTAAAAKGPLKVGVKNDVKGFGFQDPLTNKYEGMEIDLANKIAESLGYKGVEFTAVTAATRTQLLDAGTIDCVLATFTITEDRKKSWDFSTPYYTDAVTVLVEKSSGINALKDLVGKKIGVSASSTSAKALATAMAEAGLIAKFETFEPLTFKGGVTFSTYPDYPAISNALTAGTINAFCVDKSILANYLTDSRKFITEKFSPQDYGVATKKGAPISAQVENLIKTWKTDGTLNALYTKYKLN
jgi:putative glutamine transport system substrate-binding protein